MRADLQIATVFALVLGIAAFSSQASAQDRPNGRFRVQVHVGAEDRLRASASNLLSQSLQAIKDVTLATEDVDYVLSVVVMPVTNGGYALSVAVMNVYSERALDGFAQLWQIPVAARAKFKATLKGAGALVDQRAQTGPDLAELCRGVVSAFDLETLGTARKFR